MEHAARRSASPPPDEPKAKRACVETPPFDVRCLSSSDDSLGTCDSLRSDDSDDDDSAGRDWIVEEQEDVLTALQAQRAATTKSAERGLCADGISAFEGLRANSEDALRCFMACVLYECARKLKLCRSHTITEAAAGATHAKEAVAMYRRPVKMAGRIERQYAHAVFAFTGSKTIHTAPGEVCQMCSIKDRPIRYRYAMPERQPLLCCTRCAQLVDFHARLSEFWAGAFDAAAAFYSVRFRSQLKERADFKRLVSEAESSNAFAQHLRARFFKEYLGLDEEYKKLRDNVYEERRTAQH